MALSGETGIFVATDVHQSLPNAIYFRTRFVAVIGVFTNHFPLIHFYNGLNICQY
jgi:hypothetical protein